MNYMSRDTHLLISQMHSSPPTPPVLGMSFCPLEQSHEQWDDHTGESEQAVFFCSQQSLLASVLCALVQLLPLGAVPHLGKLQRKWSVTRGLAGPLPGVDNGIRFFQVSLGAGGVLSEVGKGLFYFVIGDHGEHSEVSLREPEEGKRIRRSLSPLTAFWDHRVSSLTAREYQHLRTALGNG